MIVQELGWSQDSALPPRGFPSTPWHHSPVCAHAYPHMHVHVYVCVCMCVVRRVLATLGSRPHLLNQVEPTGHTQTPSACSHL